MMLTYLILIAQRLFIVLYILDILILFNVYIYQVLHS